MSNLIFDNNTLKNYTSSISNHTDDQINKKIINPNLLINADFRNKSNIVNQRGSDIYDFTTGVGYGIDGYSSRLINQTVSSDYINLQSSIGDASAWRSWIHFIDTSLPVPGETYTASILARCNKFTRWAPKFAIGNINNGTGTMTSTNMVVSNEYQLYTYTYTFPNTWQDSQWSVILFLGDNGSDIDTNIDIKCMKLEIGSVSTLLNDSPQEYNIELLKCQRYLQPLKRMRMRCSRITTNSIEFPITLSTPMRILLAIIGTLDSNSFLIEEVTTSAYVNGFTYSLEYTPGMIGGYIIAVKASHGCIDPTLIITINSNAYLTAEF